VKIILLLLVTLSVTSNCLASSAYPKRLDDPAAVYLTAEEFHVHGDGKEDDSAAVQAAIDKLQAAKSEGVVFIPPGRYRISRTIYLWPGVRVIGYGSQRPVFVLGENTPGYQNGIAYMFFFAGARPRPVAPARRQILLESVPARFEQQHLAEFPIPQHPFEREEIPVESPILKHAEQQAAGAGKRDQFAGLGGGKREWLVDDDMLARLESGAAETVVSVVRRRDDDQVDIVGGTCRDRVPHAARRIAPQTEALRAGGSYQNDAERLGGFEQGPVKIRAGQTVSDESDAYRRARKR